ncbi:MAG: hypothetical protein MIO90_06940 [Methanomassiliicoccales archaeon]|nr:hypothetical protein [Methanomassiliicoccales archaeon]
MKFCYCTECKDLRPKSWYRGSECVICGGKCTIITIPMSIFGYLMYVLSAIGAIFVFFELMDTKLGIGDLRLYIMFGSIVLALLFSFLEMDRCTKLAGKRVGKVI